VIVAAVGVSVCRFVITMVVTVRVGMRVAVRMRVRRAVGVRVFVFMHVRVCVIVFEMHVEFRPRDARSLPARHVEVVAIQTELRQLAFELFEVKAQIQHRANEHVTADAAEDIEIKSFHGDRVKSNNEHLTPNAQLTGQRTRWMFGVEYWLLDVPSRFICPPGC
jgi:propanediol utilization protein